MMKCDYGVIFDVYQLLPEDYVTYIDDEKCDIAYFYHLILHRKKDLEYYSYMTHRMIIPIFHSQEEKQRECADIVSISNYLKQQCILYGLSIMRHRITVKKVLGEFISKLSK